MWKCLLPVLLCIHSPIFCVAQSRPSLTGAWRVVEVKVTGTNARIISNPQPALLLFTEKHYSKMGVDGDQQRQDLPADQAKATAAELLAAWEPLNAHSGTYEVTGGIITLHRIITKNPAAARPGNFAKYSFHLEGDVLTITEVGDTRGPTANPVTTKYVRAE